MLRTPPAGSSTLLLGREMFNIVQCGFIISGKTNSFHTAVAGKSGSRSNMKQKSLSHGFLGIPRSPQEVFAVACLCSIPMVSAFAAALLCCAEPSGPSGRHPAWPSSPRYFQVLAVFAVLEALGLNRVYEVYIR